MNLRDLFMLVLTFGFAAVVGATDRPNVVLIMTDDQGYADMACHGNPFINTPNIDRLHAHSMRLSDFHTDPTCSPTRAALMTGRYATRTGVWLTYGGRHHLRADERTMADVFKAGGYRTAVFGKWHLGDTYPFRPEYRGFDVALIHGGGVVGETPDYWANDYFDDTYFRNGTPERQRGYCTDVFFDQALRFIEAHRDRPFFVYLATNAPHGPHHVPWRYVAPLLKNKRLNESAARGYAMVVNLDENLGRLRDRLAALGLADNTLMIFMTDNGGTFGARLYNARLRGHKGTAYDGGHRAACFLHWPAGGLDAPRAVTPLTAHIDLLPTLIDLCGLPAPKGVAFDGRSLVPLIRGEGVDWPARTLFVHHQGRFGQTITNDQPIKYKHFAVMRGRWRLVGHGGPGDELYDITADPSQQNNVAARHADVVRQLRQAYERWWDDVTADSAPYCRTVVGHPRHPRTMLTAQQWHGETVLYNQHHIRAGITANGAWALRVAAPGRYRITLRRWPVERDQPLDARVELPPSDPNNIDTSNRLLKLPSRAIHPVKARLRVGTFDARCSVKPGDTHVTFKVPLEVGEVELKTWLIDADGTSRGAYYVYIEPIVS